ncbi:MAG: hypothetical protein GXX91_12105 [Verrucomicrobiaceae bacterium]|nr:hypothetical protein [Verrucomicrobiaceae bacterium]
MMNPTPSPDDHLPAGERFVDAALSEHARLGKDGRDAELIHRVLLETVHRGGSDRLAAPRTPAMSWRMRFAGAAAVAALVALVIAALSIPGSGLRERPSEEFHFTVRFLEPTPAAAATEPDAPAPRIAADRYAEALSLSSPGAPGALPETPAAPDYELITTLGPSFAALPAPGIRREDFRITADESLASTDRRLYQGNVVVEHARYRIEAGQVSVPAPGRTRSADVTPLLASDVTVTQESPRRVAHAKNLRFDPLSGALVLTGVESFTTDEGKLVRFAPGDQLVLRGEAFSVESPAPVRYAAPRDLTR